MTTVVSLNFSRTEPWITCGQQRPWDRAMEGSCCATSCPNSLTPVVTLIPFELAGAIGALTSLDFLGLGVPPDTPSLGELLSQAKDNLYGWWISFSTFAVPLIMLLLLILIGDALRDALDPRKVLKGDVE